MPGTSKEGREMRKGIDKVKRLITVRHLPNSSIYRPKGYASWIDFWKDKTISPIRFSEKKPFRCYCCGDDKTDFVGGHVISEGNKKYICPICKECNDMAKENNEYSERYFSVPSQLLVEFFPKRDADIVENQRE